MTPPSESPNVAVGECGICMKRRPLDDYGHCSKCRASESPKTAPLSRTVEAIRDFRRASERMGQIPGDMGDVARVCVVLCDEWSALRRENERLQRDSERLEFLVEEWASHQRDDETQENRYRLDWDSEWCVNWRAAIDAHMVQSGARQPSPVTPK